MKVAEHETVLESELNYEPFAEEKCPIDPIEKLVIATDSIREMEERVFIHLQELEEKYPDYIDFRYVYDEKTHETGGKSGWYNLVGIKSYVEEEPETTSKPSPIVGGLKTPKSKPKVIGSSGGMGIGSKSPLAYSSSEMWEKRDGTKVKMSDMNDGHLDNAIKMCDRKIVGASTKGESAHWQERKHKLEKEKDSRKPVVEEDDDDFLDVLE